MSTDGAPAIAAQLMSKFAARTGLSPAALRPQRYLWTDAFAVCNFFELFARTGDQIHRRYAVELIDQVHQAFGRYRDDDMRSGWISGLDDETGRQRPTAGGLRIGKPPKGGKVRSRKQAIAIGLSEARREGKRVPAGPVRRPSKVAR